MSNNKISIPKLAGRLIAIFACLSLIGNPFTQASVAISPMAKQQALTSRGQTTDTVGVKIVDLYTGTPLDNQTFDLMVPIVDDFVIGAEIPRTLQKYTTDAAGLMTLPTPQLKYGCAVTRHSGILIERLPNGNWLGRALPKDKLEVKAGIEALSSPDLT